MRDKEAFLTMELMMMKADQLAQMMGHDDFKATKGWLVWFCK